MIGDENLLLGRRRESQARRFAESLATEQARLLEIIARGKPLDDCLTEVAAAAAQLEAPWRNR